MIAQIAFGRTGHASTRTLFGAASLGKVDQATADRTLELLQRYGINHIDTSDFYGPHVTNQLIREALHPYPDDLVIVTKVGAIRGPRGTVHPAMGREQFVGATAEVTIPLVKSAEEEIFQGMVRLHGALWRAVAHEAIPQGARVRVTSFEGLTLHVVPAEHSVESV